MRAGHLLAMVMLMTSTAQAGAGTSLPSCPDSPNCVSSQAPDHHRIEPLRFTDAAGTAWERLRRLLSERSDTRVVFSDATTIRVEFRTRLGFVDDGLFQLEAAGRLVQVRSAARTGYWDLGKNRGRLEEIRSAFEKVPGGE